MKLSELVLESPPTTVESTRSESLERIFSEEPVPLSTFVQDKFYLNNPPLSQDQYLAVRHAEQIFYPELYPRMAEEFGEYWCPVRYVNFITLEWGKGSGKDHISRVANMRISYLLLCLRSPQAYFGMPDQDTIHLLNVASSSHQAQEAYFKPITRAVKKGWFKDKCEPKMQLIEWDKNIESVSGHSDAESQEGLNLILGVADEIDAFRSKEELEKYRARQAREPSKSAESILDMIHTSASTRFPETFKNIRISYPRYKGSTIQLLRREAEQDVAELGDDSPHYVSGPKYTWHVNPRYSKMDFVNVQGLDEQVPKALAHHFKKDLVGSKAKYMCQPERAVEAYFRNEEAVESCMIDMTPPIQVSYELQKISTKDGLVSAWMPTFEFSPTFMPVQGARYAMHGDLAVKGDRAGVAMAHVVDWQEIPVFQEDEEGGVVERTEFRPTVKVDFVISFSADLSQRPPREIQVRWARQLCFKLLERGFAVVRFTFDQFQSTDSMQILQSRGIESERLSMDLSEDPWRTARDVIYEGRATVPKNERLLGELLSLSKLANGKVDHPPGGSKDEADSFAGAIVGALEEGGREDEDGAIVIPGAVEEVALIGNTELPIGMEDVSLAWTSYPELEKRDRGRY